MYIETQTHKDTQFSFFTNKFYVFVLLCFLFSTHLVVAQTSDFAGNIGIDLSKKINRSLGIDFSQEFRFVENATHYSRSATSLGIDYRFLRKSAKFGVSYSFLNKENKDYNYEFQNRFTAQLSLNKNVNRFKLSWRGRFQETYRDEDLADYKVNPKMYFRNKFQLNYILLNSNFKPSVSCEFYYYLNHPNNKRIDKIRTTLGFDYVLSRRTSLEFFGRLDQDVQVKKPMSLYSIGVFYKYKL